MPIVNSLLEPWLVGFVVMANLMAAWFFSNFPQHLWNTLRLSEDQVYTKDDLMSAAIQRFGSFGDLWVCPICLGTWMSTAVASALPLFYPLHGLQCLQFIAAAAFTWPVCFYLLYGILKRV